jgi:RND family efflux transporter MFP subunit
MKKVFGYIRTSVAHAREKIESFWKQYRKLSPKMQAVLAGVFLFIVIGILYLVFHGKNESEANNSLKTVSVASVASLSGNETSVSLLGTVRSVSEANILAQTGGTVRSVQTTIGATVGAGSVLAQLDNASESAAVLQAQGVYEAAVAARTISSLESQNRSGTFAEAQSAAQTTYRSAYTELDGILENDVDTFFGEITPIGPRLLINPGPTQRLSERRAEISVSMKKWREGLTASQTRDPEALLNEATAQTQTAYIFLTDLAIAANKIDSRATAEQLVSLASARADVNTLLTTLSSARDSYNTKKTSAQTMTQDSGQGTATAQANVKQALGALRGAQAILEKTLLRAPIGGTVNFLPIRVGDYITSFTHVATVAQNGALEVVAYVSEADRQNLAVGMPVLIDEKSNGVITSIAPALDPSRKQIEVHLAVVGKTDLVNGTSVHITLPIDTSTKVSTIPSTLTLPLTTVKLRGDERIVFGVSPEGKLVSYPVTIGIVRGEMIEITSPLDTALIIVTDARGLSEGEKVVIAPETP